MGFRSESRSSDKNSPITLRSQVCIGDPDYVRFTCPRCGGHTFGSNGYQNTGHCNGYIGDKSCCFVWDRVDDYKYFGPAGQGSG